MTVPDDCHEQQFLKNANAHLQALIQAIPDMVYFKDVHGRYGMVNRAMETVSGIAAGRLAGMTSEDHLPPDAAARCRESDRIALEGNRPVQTEEYIDIPGGTRRHFDIVKSPIRDAAGDLLGLVAVCRDITERKNIEDALRRSEKFNRDILESVDEAFIVIDRDFRIISANKAYLDQVKRPLREVIGKACFAVSHGSTASCHEQGEPCAVLETFATGEPRTALHTHRDREQDPVYVEIKSYPLKDGEGRTVAAIEIINNISEKKRLEEQLRHAQKMEAVGQLAGGIAHDFNNILTAIIGYGSLLKSGLAPDDPLRHDAVQILDAAERAANLTRGLLTFSRKQPICPAAVNVNEIIGNTERLLRRVIGEDVEIRFQPTCGELAVMADVSHFEQVLMNLATNAKDAMPNGGRITISTASVHLGPGFIRTYGYGKQGDYARITVADTGAGMDSRTKLKIFEPFFTTKARGKGTGLGLSIVYGIVKQHSGFIVCDSLPGAGTRFDIYLPLVQGRAAPPLSPGVIAPGGGTETILLVEDDAAVRKLIRNILERNGYGVIDAGDGEEAVERFRENSDRVQLLLLDFIMPKKNGNEVIAAIGQIRPGLPAIFLSGYTADYVARYNTSPYRAAFLAKPVSPPQLLRKVRDILDESRA